MDTTLKINPEHPRIKNRTGDSQIYRDDLAKTLKQSRAMGFIGKKDAESELSREKINFEYILNHYGYTKLGAEKLIEAGQGGYLLWKLENFEGLDHDKIAEKLIESGQGHDVILYLEDFKLLDYNKIAEKLIEAGEGCYLVSNSVNFKGLDHNKIAEKLIEVGEGRYVAEYLKNFEGLDQKIVEKLIELGYIDSVRHNIEI